jgi:hypothetical protein
MFLSSIAYIASAFILFSFTMKDQIKLRIFNSIGAALFVYYSLMRLDYPVVFINVSVIIINLYFIIKSKKNENI